MQRRLVCAIEDLPPGSVKLVPAGKFGVGVYNIDGALYAIANYCSHEGAPLCAGYVGGTNEYAPDMPGQLRHVRAGRVARCPWHQWEFDITTGVNLAESPQARPHLRGRHHRRAGVPHRMSEACEANHRRQRPAAFPLQRGDPAVPGARAQAAVHPGRRAAVVPGPRR